MSHTPARVRWLVLAVLLGVLALSSVARASDTQPVDQGEGTQTDCPVYSSSDPNCTLPAPPGGAGIPCLDPALPCDHGGGGSAGGATTTTLDAHCGGRIISHFNDHPPAIGEFANTRCPRSANGETRGDFARAYATMSDEPRCVVGTFIRLTFAAEVTSRGEIVSADAPHFGQCFTLRVDKGVTVLGTEVARRPL